MLRTKTTTIIIIIQGERVGFEEMGCPDGGRLLGGPAIMASSVGEGREVVRSREGRNNNN